MPDIGRWHTSVVISNISCRSTGVADQLPRLVSAGWNVIKRAVSAPKIWFTFMFICLFFVCISIFIYCIYRLFYILYLFKSAGRNVISQALSAPKIWFTFSLKRKHKSGAFSTAVWSQRSDLSDFFGLAKFDQKNENQGHMRYFLSQILDLSSSSDKEVSIFVTAVLHWRSKLAKNCS